MNKNRCVMHLGGDVPGASSDSAMGPLAVVVVVLMASAVALVFAGAAIAF